MQWCMSESPMCHQLIIAKSIRTASRNRSKNEVLFLHMVWLVLERGFFFGFGLNTCFGTYTQTLQHSEICFAENRDRKRETYIFNYYPIVGRICKLWYCYLRACWQTASVLLSLALIPASIFSFKSWNADKKEFPFNKPTVWTQITVLYH